MVILVQLLTMSNIIPKLNKLLTIILLYFLIANGVGIAQQKNPTINEPAPTFALKSIENEYVYLRDFCGKLRPPTKDKKQRVVIVSFFASWCKPCHKEISELKTVLTEFSDKDIQLLLINLKEDKAKVEQFLKNKNYPGLILLDKYGMVAKRYGVTTLPRLFVIAKDGSLVWKTSGYSENFRYKLKSVLRDLI